MKKINKICFTIFFTIIIYLFIRIATAPIFANICLCVFVLWQMKYVFVKAKIRFLSETLINELPKQLKINDNVLINSHCIVKYFPKEKIVVIDKPNPKSSINLRSFVINKDNSKNILYCWGEICTIFDELTYLDTLYSYFDGFSGKFNIKFIDLSSNDPIISDMAEFLRKDNDELKKEESKLHLQAVKKKNDEPVLVDINNLKTVTSADAENNDNSDNNDAEYLEELNSEDLIYVNYADAQKISELPGINIIKAKKIVAYRDLNGLYRRKDDFIVISEVRKHFIPIIKKMISLEKDPQVNDSYNNPDYGRTVD